MLSREILMRWRERMLGVGRGLKAALGVVLIVTSGLVLSGTDRALETLLVNASPDWLTALTTRF
jgi:hypothetical protein